MINMDGFFIDKLCVVQDHKPDNFFIPHVGQYINYRVDLKTGSTSESIGDLHFEGSYSSSLMIRSDGFRVSVYGNPSRWNRIDNLFGLKTLDDCMAVYNHILQGLGLPEFTKCTKYYYAGVTGNN